MNWKDFINYGLKGQELLSENKRITSYNECIRAKLDSTELNLIQLNSLNASLRTELDLLQPKEVKVSNSTFFKTTNQKYRWQPNKYTNLRESLNRFTTDAESQEKYLGWLLSLGLKDHYVNEDKMVWYVTKMVYDYVSDDDDYDTDKESFGVNEYWLTPQSAFDYYVTAENQGDCDDMSALLYGALITALNYCGYSDLFWRLKRVNIKKPVGHAICAWLNNKNQWKRIESTYYRSDFATKWNDDSDVFKGAYTIVWHIFDDKKEYKLK